MGEFSGFSKRVTQTKFLRKRKEQGGINHKFDTNTRRTIVA